MTTGGDDQGGETVTPFTTAELTVLTTATNAQGGTYTDEALGWVVAGLTYEQMQVIRLIIAQLKALNGD